MPETVELVAGEGETISDVDGDRAGALVAVGSTVWRRDSTGWHAEAVPGLRSLLRAVTVLPDGRAWAVGRNGTAVFFDGATWRVEKVEGAGYYDLIDVAAGADEVWATAAGPEVYRRSGAGWLALLPPGFVGRRAQALFSPGAGRLFVEVHPEATGTASAIAVLDAGSDVPAIASVGAPGYIRSIQGDGDEVWAVGVRTRMFGKGGQSYRFSGGSWHAVELPVDVPMWSVRARAGLGVWMSGDRGVVLHGDAAGFSEVRRGARAEVARVVLPTRDGELRVLLQQGSATRVVRLR